jgi:adenosylhomocysteine nucleosidase
VVALEMGVGASAASAAMSWLLTRANRPERVILAGFAGALDPTLRIGDLVIGDLVCVETGQVWSCDPLSMPGATMGRVLCVNRMICDPAEKADLLRRHGAIAVEMEAATVAAECARHGVAFSCLRAISDTATDRLSPELLNLLAGGSVRVGPLVFALLRRPGMVAELLRLGSATRCAARRLGEAL